MCASRGGRTIGIFEQVYTITKCSGCGLTRTSSRPIETETEHHYAEEYIPSTTELDRDFGGRRRAALKRVAEEIRSDVSEGSMLDIGSAGGELLSHFGDGWELTALEPSAVGAEELRQRGYEVVHDFFPSNDLEGSTFDVITMMDVIMIMPDPVGALEAARSMINPNGRLYVEIPGHLYRTLLHVGPVPMIRSRRWTDLNAKVHLFFFDKRSMTKMLTRCGFSLERVVPLPPSTGFGAAGAVQQRVSDVVDRLPAVRSGRPSLAAKYLFVANPS